MAEPVSTGDDVYFLDDKSDGEEGEGTKTGSPLSEQEMVDLRRTRVRGGGEGRGRGGGEGEGEGEGEGGRGSRDHWDWDLSCSPDPPPKNGEEGLVMGLEWKYTL